MVTHGCLKLTRVLAFLIGIVSIGGIITLVVLWHTKLTPFEDYSVVVDAGSTHSTVFLYRWPADKSDGIGSTSRVTQKTSCNVPGNAITSITDPTENNAKQYFNSAMTECINQIPSNRKGRALIFLGGTAGLRLFEMQNASYTNNLLASTRAYFGTLGLLIKAPEYQVRIISGSEEGLSGWVSTNILMQELYTKNNPIETYGVTEIGGASTQMSFISPNATSERYAMDLFNTKYDIYSHSYLCYGAEQLRYIYIGQLVNESNGSLLIDDPCLQDGYILNITYNDIFSRPCVLNQSTPSPGLNPSSIFSFTGSGDSEACAAAVRARLNTRCTSPPCSFDNVYQPKPIPPSIKFIAISAWYSTFDSLAPNVSLAPNSEGNYDFTSVNLTRIKTAIAAVCNQSWSDLIKPNKFRPFLCFNSWYHWTLLEHGYSMTDENLKKFQIVKKVNGNEIGWTLGYMINQTNSLDAEFRPARLLTQGEFGGLLFVFSFLLILSIIIICVAVKNYRRQNHMELRK